MIVKRQEYYFLLTCSRWEHIKDDGQGTVEHIGTVMECIPLTRLVFTWVGPAYAGDPTKHSTVTIDLETFGGRDSV